MLRLANIRVSIDNEKPLELLAARELKIPAGSIKNLLVVRRAIDARRKNQIIFVYTIEVETDIPEGKILAHTSPNVQQVVPSIPAQVQPGRQPLNEQPVIIGAGPAGLFAALTLAEYGYKPLLLERGQAVDERTRTVTKFWQTGEFDSSSNVQFGEGGAGTFSDGKLTTRVNDPMMSRIIERFIEAGAPEEIRYQHKPHVGTDKLRTVVKNIRKQIIALGGQVRFGAHVTDFDIQDGAIRGIIINGQERLPCQVVVLAIGHSARDTYTVLYQHKVAMQAKPFAIGVRVEHPQQLIDEAQYGPYAGHPKLGAADYSLVFHDKNSGRTAYSFCMCPGGVVVASASEQGGVVTNGMSGYLRNSGIANSAIVVNVNPADCGPGVLSGIEFQRHYEQLAYQLGGQTYYAPVQTVGDFTGRGTAAILQQPSYRPGTVPADLRQCLPGFVTDTLALAFVEFDRKITGFAHSGAILTGVETRTSAPIRIPRSEDFISENTAGLYPAGEGAGYAGGIMSAALDGLNCAVSIIKTYQAT